MLALARLGDERARQHRISRRRGHGRRRHPAGWRPPNRGRDAHHDQHRRRRGGDPQDALSPAPRLRGSGGYRHRRAAPGRRGGPGGARLPGDGQQLVAKLLRGLRTFGRLLLERAQDEALHRLADGRVGLPLPRWDGRLVDVAGEHFHRARSVERQVARGHLEEDHAQRVEVAAFVQGAARGLLRRHVLRSAADHVVPRQPGLLGIDWPDDSVARQRRHVRPENFGDAEIEHLDVVGLVAPLLDHHVLRLQVAVDDVIDMRFAQRRADLRHDVAEPLLGERPVVAQDEAQVLSLHVLHDDVERPVVFQPAEVEHLDDVRMVESAGRLRLALEASHQRRILEQLRLEHLERHRPLEREVAGPVHLAHPART